MPVLFLHLPLPVKRYIAADRQAIANRHHDRPSKGLESCDLALGLEGRLDCTAQSPRIPDSQNLSKRWDRLEQRPSRHALRAPTRIYSMPWWPLGIGPLLLVPSHRIPVSQANQRATAEGTNPPRWSVLGRTESPAAWKREKGSESAQVASGMFDPWPVCLFGLWGSHSTLPALLARLSTPRGH